MVRLGPHATHDCCLHFCTYAQAQLSQLAFGPGLLLMWQLAQWLVLMWQLCQCSSCAEVAVGTVACVRQPHPHLHVPSYDTGGGTSAYKALHCTAVQRAPRLTQGKQAPACTCACVSVHHPPVADACVCVHHPPVAGACVCMHHPPVADACLWRPEASVWRLCWCRASLCGGASRAAAARGAAQRTYRISVARWGGCMQHRRAGCRAVHGAVAGGCMRMWRTGGSCMCGAAAWHCHG